MIRGLLASLAAKPFTSPVQSSVPLPCPGCDMPVSTWQHVVHGPTAHLASAPESASGPTPQAQLKWTGTSYSVCVSWCHTVDTQERLAGLCQLGLLQRLESCRSMERYSNMEMALHHLHSALQSFAPRYLCLNSKVSRWHTPQSSEISQESYTLLGSLFKIWFVFIAAVEWSLIIFPLWGESQYLPLLHLPLFLPTFHSSPFFPPLFFYFIFTLLWNWVSELDGSEEKDRFELKPSSEEMETRD